MAKINGTAIIPLIDSNAVLHSSNATLTINADLPDATTKDSAGWADHIQGLRDWSLTLEGFATYDPTDDGNIVDFSDLVLNRSTASMEFANSTVDDRKFTGTVSLASLELGAPMEETATMSVTLTGKGELSTSVVS